MYTPKQLFDSMDLEWVQHAIAERETETLHLDFKCLADPSFGKDDRRTLAKAASAFLNSDGGLIVYGVECKPNAEGEDAAKSLCEIGNLRKATSRLQALLSEVVSPICETILVRAIETGPDSGLLLVYLPISDSAPHMARGADGRYYKRSGSSSVPMEHFDLEDMFGRRPHPNLSLQVSLFREGRSSGGGGPPKWTVHMVFSILNAGRGIARYPLLGLYVREPYAICPYGIDGNRHNGLPERKSGSGTSRLRVFAGGVDDIVHQSTRLPVCKVRMDFAEGYGDFKPVLFTYRLAADGIRTVESEGTITTIYLSEAANNDESVTLAFRVGDQKPLVVEG